MASEQFSLCWDNFHKNMSSGMNSLLESEDLVDVTLAVQGRCLKAHKMVLSVCSPYFKELFKSNPCQHPIVFMKDVSYEALSDLLQFMYQGEVQVSQENLTTFIKTAEALQIKGLTGDGNGSTDTETTESLEKSTHQPTVDEYKPVQVPRPKKLPPSPVVTTTPAPKRQRLSQSSSDSQSLPMPYTKTEPALTSASTAEPVHFKMEDPYDHNQSLMDDAGDDNFGDDTMDDTTALDDNEDCSILEEGNVVGEGEPQAGTSTDGAGEGQETETPEKTLIIPKQEIQLSSNGIVVNGFSYHRNTTKQSSRYFICSEYKKSVCKARAVIPACGNVDELILTREHNHPPQREISVKDNFIKQIKRAILQQPNKPLREVYQDIASVNPEGLLICPFAKIYPSMRRWRGTIWKGDRLI